MNDGVDGILVKPRDETALASAITTLANDENRREQMINKGREKANAHNWESIAQRTLDYYAELSGAK